jgi:hypothetical protein
MNLALEKVERERERETSVFPTQPLLPLILIIPLFPTSFVVSVCRLHFTPLPSLFSIRNLKEDRTIEMEMTLGFLEGFRAAMVRRKRMRRRLV